MKKIDFSPRDNRIIALAKKITEIYSVSELEKLAPISPQTIIRWAESEHRPSKSASSSLPIIIAVSDQDFNDYLEGNISLEELWDRKGSAKRIQTKTEITLQTVLNDAKMLSTMELLKLISNLFLIISPGELIYPTQPPIKCVELSAQAKLRLKTLLNVSNAYKNQTIQSIIESGADKALIEDMVKDFENDFIEPVYQTLLPFLCYVEKWVENNPIPNPSKTFTSVTELTNILNAS
jgi:hypothetical protein